jgi:hypothetical protein
LLATDTEQVRKNKKNKKPIQNIVGEEETEPRQGQISLEKKMFTSYAHHPSCLTRAAGSPFNPAQAVSTFYRRQVLLLHSGP